MIRFGISRVRHTTSIFVVTGVDKTLAHPATFEGGITHPDTQPEDLRVGQVLARVSRLDMRWQAGRTRPDGVHWEQRTWPPEDFAAFRDHVAELLEIKPSPQERLAEMAANCGVANRNWRRMQARHDRSAQDYAEFEGLIAEAGNRAVSLQEELTALQPSTPELAGVAR